MEDQNLQEQEEVVEQEVVHEQEQQNDACQQELAQLKDKFVRIAADFQNYKNRTEKEKTLWMQQAQQSVIKDILTIYDDFDRALGQQHEQSVENLDSWLAGFKMIYDSLTKMLEKYGIKEISCDQFDPEHHEALLHVDSEDHESGQIVQVLQKGFMMKDVVIRPSKVSVAK